MPLATPTKRNKRRAIAGVIHDRFYLWFGRRYPNRKHLIEDTFTRRDLRDAYEAGVRAQCRAIARGDK